MKRVERLADNDARENVNYCTGEYTNRWEGFQAGYRQALEGAAKYADEFGANDLISQGIRALADQEEPDA